MSQFVSIESSSNNSTIGDTPLKLIKPDPSVFSHSGYQSKSRLKSFFSSDSNLNYQENSTIFPTPKTPSKKINTKFYLPSLDPTLGSIVYPRSSPVHKRISSLNRDDAFKNNPGWFSNSDIYEVENIKHSSNLRSNSLQSRRTNQVLKKLKFLSENDKKNDFNASQPSYQKSIGASTVLEAPAIDTLKIDYPSRQKSPLIRKISPSILMDSSDHALNENSFDETFSPLKKFNWSSQNEALQNLLLSSSTTDNSVFHHGHIDTESPFLSSKLDDHEQEDFNIEPEESSTEAYYHFQLDQDHEAQADYHHHHHHHHDIIKSKDEEEDIENNEFHFVSMPIHPTWTTYPHFLDFDYFQCGDLYSLSNDNMNEMYTSDYLTDHFEVFETIGHGSFADVFKVILKKNPLKVFALKRTTKPYLGMNDRIQRLSEPKVMWKLGKYPNCVEIVNAWEQFGHLHILMEYCHYGSLLSLIHSTIIESERFTEEKIWNVLYQISLGLEHIHSMGFVHLDIKPANIFINSYGLFKIGDFGLAKSVGWSHDIDMEGDKIYMAPELLQGNLVQSADMFSLGLILLELAANIELPSQGESWQNLRSGKFDDIHFDRLFISDTLIELIFLMLNPDPTLRPSWDHIIRESSLHIVNPTTHS